MILLKRREMKLESDRVLSRAAHGDVVAGGHRMQALHFTLHDTVGLLDFVILYAFVGRRHHVPRKKVVTSRTLSPLILKYPT
ncbi:hypothetical protein V496_04030 [Pseudogymnoascus sp. VKM F-4515 (FW-2607)]|nr:hypothetical protein V496_04030 [Pseudogymnoascus sp. VKM F-4515 (FW-2607)]